MAAREAFARAREHFLAEDSVHAAEELRRAVELAPEWVEYRVALGKLLYTLCSVRFSTATFDRSCLEQAIADLARACELDPRSIEALYWTGRALEKVPDVPAARARFEAVLALDPSHGPAHKELGLLAAAEGDAERAKDFLTRAGELLPKDDEVLFQLGMQLESEQRLEDAKALFQRAAELNPAHPGPLTGLVRLHQRLGEAAAAADASERLMRCKEFGKRLAQAQHFRDTNPRDAGACLALGVLYAEVGMSAPARGWAEKALRLDPASAAALELLKKLGPGPAAAGNDFTDGSARK